MKILVLGITGMLGNAMLRVLSKSPTNDVWATARDKTAGDYFDASLAAHIIHGIDMFDEAALAALFDRVKPDAVVNCIGLVKQLADANEPLHAIPINALLPHRLAALCATHRARLIHISTDCVFSGKKGNYVETDFPDADDLYGRSKLLGEVVASPHAITLRTSIIGHELKGQHSLISWFLAQNTSVKGFTKAIFSGLSTDELARVVRDVVLPRPELHGLYHVAAQPINKFDLLSLVAKTYHKDIEIIADAQLSIDRSLNAKRFHDATDYTPPEWSELIERMHEFNIITEDKRRVC